MGLKEIRLRVWIDSSGSGQGPVAGSCEHGNEPSRSINCGEFVDQLNACQLLKKDCSMELTVNCKT
jgi:hypothetical protein